MDAPRQLPLFTAFASALVATSASVVATSLAWTAGLGLGGDWWWIFAAIALVLGALLAATILPGWLLLLRRRRLRRFTALAATIGVVLAAVAGLLIRWFLGYNQEAGLAALLAAVFSALFGGLVTRLITREKASPNCCPTCGYNLRGDLAAGCPECGWGRGSGGSEAAAG